jgi:hypothetical protein
VYLLHHRFYYRHSFEFVAITTATITTAITTVITTTTQTLPSCPRPRPMCTFFTIAFITATGVNLLPSPPPPLPTPSPPLNVTTATITYAITTTIIVSRFDEVLWQMFDLTVSFVIADVITSVLATITEVVFSESFVLKQPYLLTMLYCNILTNRFFCTAVSSRTY